MTQYIPKSEVVAEIERRKEENKENYQKYGNPYDSVLRDEMEDILSFLNTLEAKEEGLENGNMTVIFQSNTGIEIGRWENWQGQVPQKGDIIYDPSWNEDGFKKRFINAQVTGQVLLSSNPNEIIIYIG